MYSKLNVLFNNKVIKNIFSMGLLKVLNIFLNFVLVGVIYRYLNSQELNGVWLTVFSVLSWITLCDFGMGNGLRNKLTEAIVTRDFQTARKYISTTYIFMLIPISILIGICIVFISLINWNSIFNLQTISLSENYLRCFIIIVMTLYAIKFYLTIINAVFNSLFKNYVVTLMQLIDNIVTLFVLCILMLLGHNDLILLGIVYGLIPLITLVTFSIILFSTYEAKIKPSIKYFDFKILRSIGGIGIKFLVLQGAIIILFTTDSLIISKFVGVNEVTPYQLTNKLLGIFKIVLGIILTNIWGIILEYKTLKQNDKIYETIKNILKVFSILSLLTILLGLFTQFILTIWIGESIEISILLIILMIIYNIIHMWCDIFQSICNGMGKLNVQVFVYSFAAVINIPLSIILITNTTMGVSAVILATIISLVTPSVFLPIIIFRDVRLCKG